MSIRERRGRAGGHIGEYRHKGTEVSVTLLDLPTATDVPVSPLVEGDVEEVYPPLFDTCTASTVALYVVCDFHPSRVQAPGRVSWEGRRDPTPCRAPVGLVRSWCGAGRKSQECGRRVLAPPASSKGRTCTRGFILRPWMTGRERRWSKDVLLGTS